LEGRIQRGPLLFSEKNDLPGNEREEGINLSIDTGFVFPGKKLWGGGGGGGGGKGGGGGRGGEVVLQDGKTVLGGEDPTADRRSVH